MKQLDPITLMAAGQPITILLVDDDEDDIEFISDALKESRLTNDAKSVRDGEGVSMVHDQRPLVLTPRRDKPRRAGGPIRQFRNPEFLSRTLWCHRHDPASSHPAVDG